MKKYLNQALIFAIYGLCAGVFFREFTKLKGFTDRTMLGMAHPHILLLGSGVFLTIALFVKVLDMAQSRGLRLANIFYLCGITVASVMMLVRGAMEVADITIDSGIDGMIAGIAGLGHMATAAGIILFLVAIRKAAKNI